MGARQGGLLPDLMSGFEGFSPSGIGSIGI